MERLHKLFIYRKKLVRPYIEQLLKWMDIITYVMSALLIMTLVYEHGFLISFQEIGVINRLYHIVWVVFLVDTTLHLLLNYSDTRRKYRGLAWLLSVMLYLTLIPVVFHEPEIQGGIHTFGLFFQQQALPCDIAHSALFVAALQWNCQIVGQAHQSFTYFCVQFPDIYTHRSGSTDASACYLSRYILY